MNGAGLPAESQDDRRTHRASQDRDRKRQVKDQEFGFSRQVPCGFFFSCHACADERAIVLVRTRGLEHGFSLQLVCRVEQVVLHFATFAGGEPISMIIQLAKVLRVSGVSERTQG